MKTKAGVWIDREHAIVVTITNSGEELKSFHAGISEPFPQTTETKGQHEYTRNDFIAEDKLERKETNNRRQMHDAVLRFIGDVDALYVLGPGEAKNEFKNYVSAKSHDRVAITLETSDKMTDPQLTVKIREHYNA